MSCIAEKISRSNVRDFQATPRSFVRIGVGDDLQKGAWVGGQSDGESKVRSPRVATLTGNSGGNSGGSSGSGGGRAFTLVEILVVIVIIGLLTSLTIAVGMRMKTQSRISHTKVILNICKSVSDEYVTKFHDRKIPHFGNGNGLDEVHVDWSTAKTKNAPNTTGSAIIDDPIERFVWLALQYNVTEKMLAALGHNNLFDTDGDGFMEVLDGFGNKLYYAMEVLYDDDGDGVKTDTEGAGDADDFLPEHANAFFASAGPDHLWGNAKILPIVTDINNDGDDDGKDNLYSYDQN